LRYQATNSAGKNIIINGGFDIWQRGTSFTGLADDAFSADRFAINLSGTTISANVTQDTSVPNANSKYSIKVLQATTSATSLTEYALRQNIEQSNVLSLLGKACVLSFWYKSNKTGSHGIRAYTDNTGYIDQRTTFTVNAADTWEFKQIAITAFSTVTAASEAPTARGGLIDIGFCAASTGFSSVSANDYFQIAQVQLEVGSVATAFTRSAGTIQGELAACQRYFNRITEGTLQAVCTLQAIGTTSAIGTRTFPTMRTGPTVTYTTIGDFYLRNALNTALQCTSSGAFNINTQSFSLNLSVASGLVAGNATEAYTSGAGAKLDLSAEL
jgi:hypothetical protein